MSGDDGEESTQRTQSSSNTSMNTTVSSSVVGILRSLNSKQRIVRSTKFGGSMSDGGQG